MISGSRTTAPSPFDKATEWLKPYAKKNSVRFVAQEVLGSGVPHVALGMNLGDRVDQFYQQFAQEAGSYLSTLGYSKLVQNFYEHHEARLPEASKPQANAWKGLGVAMAALPMLAATDYAAMNMRNYLTSKTFKTHNFADLVGLGKSTPQQETEDHKKERYAFEHQQLQTIGKALGIGLALGAAGSGWAFSQMKRGAKLPSWLTHSFKIPFSNMLSKQTPLKETSLHKLLSFKDGSMNNITGLQVFSSFGTFGYSGLILAARSPVEQFEAWVKFGWYGFANMVFPTVVSKGLDKKMEGWSKGDADKKKVYQFMAETATGAVLYAMPPTLACLFTRRKRNDEYNAKQQG
jgi:hypothetical protein